MKATDEQVQAWSDQIGRTGAERLRDLGNFLDSVTGDAFESVFLNLTQSNPSSTFTDNRSSKPGADNPPNLLTPGDLLALNSLFGAVKDAIKTNPNYPIALKACVRPAD